jgi:hypothetical protein
MLSSFDIDQEIYTKAFGMYAVALRKFILFDQENALISGRIASFKQMPFSFP